MRYTIIFYTDKTFTFSILGENNTPQTAFSKAYEAFVRKGYFNFRRVEIIAIDMLIL